MIFDNSPPHRRFLVPEVVQTSAMDCGPAALKALLEGFGIHVSYGRLREACQTSVDGTSIDTLEVVANQLGLEAYQIMVPLNHLFLPETQLLPALTVIRLPNGLTHFVILWRNHGRFVQVMDPGVGRRWLTKKQVLEDLYLHTQTVPVEVWYEWASSDGFCDPLRQRLTELELPESTQEELIQAALATEQWQTLAALDAATRMTATLVRTGGLHAGPEASRVLERFFKSGFTGDHPIPAAFWSVKTPADDTTQLLFQAPVLLQISGLKETQTADDSTVPPLSPELLAALTVPVNSPERHLWQLLKTDGLLTPSLLLIAAVLATLGTTLLPLTFKFLLEIGQHLELISERITALEALTVFLIILLLLHGFLAFLSIGIGRRLETRLRLVFLQKIPRLGDHYFHSRLTSDMTERAYGLIVINQLPQLALNFLLSLFTLALTALGIIFLSPTSFWLALLAVGVASGLPFLVQPVLTEQDMRFRTHEAALSRFYLDALLGLVPIRTHGAARSLRSEHESLLVNWFHTGVDLAQVRLFVVVATLMINTSFMVWIIFDYVEHGGEASGVLVLLYWTLRLPALGMEIADLAQQYPMLRNRVSRLLEPLTAPDETEMWYNTTESPNSEVLSAEGVAITLQDVTVQVAGQPILQDISIEITPGEQVAIVGSSGAGKSSLVGLLLGWYHPVVGEVRVDGELLQGDHLHQLRQETAWVDPSIQIWNRSLRDNLYYGAQAPTKPLQTIIDQADLLEILEKLPDGENTSLGEGGGLVSGGEGQRVRLGRAMLRPAVKLVILDEPFRGLDRGKRRLLLERARHYWKGATLLFISHDVGDTQTFERVLVIEAGHLVEDAAPAGLLAQPESRYHTLLAAEKAVRQELWEDEVWRHLWLEKGQLRETPKT